ncbi:uncharacterized protein PGTG_21432 [Puccinia graminis f. sp. tritici CRL 75-36-700-3]|uniref:Uncharacterized protein n=1 Tax=Puccinia graminis f. sp. tritici (strain CRL 75-36-700-3 / race SCCL) TaxID=418459 RepID=H6QRB1_PUCGT|nr:uncharacterized protein PGTG_21432 [Puccinia graminis f. sp. tritici CRL 75-36-700-3]EHS63102.1 hypothetical protein PGTG_21432 [Puccinia graminis f. sp. tritici CRL 75-36-700-3]
MVSLSFLLRPMIILCFSFLFGRIIADSGLIRTTYNGAVEETYVCSGEKRVATLLLSGPDKNRMFSWKGKRVTALSGNCDCAPERDGVRLLVCQEEPDFDLHKGTDPDTPPTCCNLLKFRYIQSVLHAKTCQLKTIWSKTAGRVTQSRAQSVSPTCAPYADLQITHGKV